MVKVTVTLLIFIIWVFCTILGGHANRIRSDRIVMQAVDGRYRNFIQNNEQSQHNISIEGDDFMLDGQSLHIISGSLHYFRLPAAYWRDRLRKLKAAGLNSVATYVEWSFHETEERQYDFEGDRDVTSFIKLAAEEGLHVLLRPGPYICAERDLGGLPYWLLSKYPNIKLRSTDINFMRESKIWMAKLFEQLKPLLFGNGGPIILVQVENEYGSYGNDTNYKEQIRDIIREHVGTNAILYTTDGSTSWMFKNGAVSGALTTIDFAEGTNVVKVYKSLREFMPSGPLMNSEYYTGWLTKWTEPLAETPTESVVYTFKQMLNLKINVNFYMFFGGSNFEFTSGALSRPYKPDITSYDYDAPLTEAGDPTPKYFAIRNTLKLYVPGLENIPEPTPTPKGAYGEVRLNFKLRLLSEQGISTLGKKYSNVQGETLPTFEKLKQRAGLVLYETQIDSVSEGYLTVEQPRDLVFVYIDGKRQGIISRVARQTFVKINAANNATLSLLVENLGRINYGADIHDFKGILGSVKINGHIINNVWTVTGFPLTNPIATDIKSEVETIVDEVLDTPSLYQGELVISQGEPLDTYIDTTGWTKGYIWVNGHNLGRYWPVAGPQVTLYVPGIWLVKAPQVNYIQLLELQEPNESISINFIDHAILNRTRSL